MMTFSAAYGFIFQRQSTEMTDACSKLPPKLFDMPLCRLLCWFACPKEPPTPGHLSKLFGPSRTGTILILTYFYGICFNLVSCICRSNRYLSSPLFG